MVHGLGEFLQGALEWEWLPAFAAIEGQAVRASTEWREPKALIRTVLIGAPDDQMTATRNDVQPAGDLARLEQRL